MTWVAVGLALVNVIQIVALAWIAAWQQRAAFLVRRVNGQVAELEERVRLFAPDDDQSSKHSASKSSA